MVVRTGTGFLEQVTPVVLTYNESPNLARTLARLEWAREVVVLDSGSDDGTEDICSQFPNVRFVYRCFDSHANQWNFATAETGVSTPWVLALDADYVLTPQLVAELAALKPSPQVDGYHTRFRYCVFGKPLRGTLYPPVTTLFRAGKGRYVQDGHTQRLSLPGALGTLQAYIDHDDRKPLSRWMWAQDRYAALEVELLRSKPVAELRIQDKLRKLLVVTPWLVPLYCLTVGRGLLDGWPGIFYALQRGVAETILSLKLLESRLRPQAAEGQAAARAATARGEDTA